MRSALIAILCAACACLPSQAADTPVVSIGKQLAAASSMEWEVRELTHPVMGPIKVAVQKRAVATAVRGEAIVSTAFVSCEKGAGKIAIELANAPQSDAKGGLGPMELPRLVCNRPRREGDGVMAKSDLAASWEIGALGDTLARGLSPAALRQCVSIDVLQVIALPPGWGQESRRVSMELDPYGRELDAVFAACGEATAWASDRAPARGPASAARTAPSSAASEGAPAADAWSPARTISQGRTNVRAAEKLGSAVVVQLPPGVGILVQATQSEWWKVKPRKGSGFSGYVRRDRFTLE